MCKYILIVANKAFSTLMLTNKMKIADAWPLKLWVVFESQWLWRIRAEIAERSLSRSYSEVCSIPVKYMYILQIQHWNCWLLTDQKRGVQTKFDSLEIHDYFWECNIKSASFTVCTEYYPFTLLRITPPCIWRLQTATSRICNQIQVFIIIFLVGGRGSGRWRGYISCNHFKSH